MALHAVEIEGIVDDIQPSAGGATLQIMGISVFVDPSLAATPGQKGSLHSPTADLTIEMLTRTAALPGRAGIQGFKQGTAIVLGNYDSLTNTIAIAPPIPPANQGAIEFEANPSLTIEPGETVVLGPITKNDATGLAVNGIPVVTIADDRIPSEPVRNEFGFEVILSTVPLMTTASVEGYYGSDNQFHAFIIETDGTLVHQEPQISFLRGEGRLRGAVYELKIRGAVATVGLPAGTVDAIVELHRVDVVGGVEQVTFLENYKEVITAGSPFVRFDIDDEFARLAPPLDVVPTKIRVVLANATPTTHTAKEGEIEVR